MDPLWLIIVAVTSFFVVREYGEWRHIKGRTAAYREAMDIIHDPAGMNRIICTPSQVVEAALQEYASHPPHLSPGTYRFERMSAERIAENLITITEQRGTEG